MDAQDGNPRSTGSGSQGDERMCSKWGTGSYLTACWRHATGRVTNVEIDQLAKFGADNLAAPERPTRRGADGGRCFPRLARRAPYDVIVFTGSMEVLPEEYFRAAEKPHWRVFCRRWQTPVMAAAAGHRKRHRWPPFAPCSRRWWRRWSTPVKAPAFVLANTEQWLNRLMPRHSPPRAGRYARGRLCCLMYASREFQTARIEIQSTYQCRRWLRVSENYVNWPGTTNRSGRDLSPWQPQHAMRVLPILARQGYRTTDQPGWRH